MKGVKEVAVLLMMVGMCWSWGYTGHQTVAQLADTLLTPQTAASVALLMEPGQTLAAISTWPDDYDESTTGSATECEHFVNMYQDQIEFNYSRNCGTVDGIGHCCVVASIRNYTRQVQDLVWERRRGNILPYLDGEPTPLSFLVHYIGDIHQPLHVSYDCDAGGNFVDTNFNGQSMNLHAVWDYGMIEEYLDDYVKLAALLLEEILHNPAISERYELYMLPELWATESYNEYTRHKVYDFSEDGLNSNIGDPVVYPFNTCPIEQTIDLPDSYYDRNILVIKQRLMAGGIRLAKLLNSIFDPSASTYVM
mmetsp:Transcript_9620/g.26970  ORF Transcript_9620/g.26970 Transcript_9620/m.26970 type:complete len:308 (+) Transcript_9620:85-1008(+)|eukprot:CAMPEP_0119129100 /NCGR_PEP_ID=MMETSP1310-20130426/6990_1 /TAXON_ID=464262 /ORGANISM="Genus nov. species nov., Strain RCC2339" /LENGTH=307 /DNA_ID=CAMNT_0007119505 /DNA_START=75 /DNA_END=998 /DNA_ORIENTATION=+